MRYSNLRVSALATVASMATATISLSDIPWSKLSSRLSPSALLLDTSPDIYVDECVPPFQEYGPTEISHYDIEASGSTGLCMNSLCCGYQECNPSTESENGLEVALTLFSYLTDYYEGRVTEIFTDATNPRFNLPYKILQPTNAGDIVAAIEFAVEHNVEISVKNSGHNYNGASTKKDSILIHTPSLPQYSKFGLQDCAQGEDVVAVLESGIDDSLSNQPCLLARARKVAGVMRVGGGEDFSDFYNSVKALNEIALQENGAYKYHPVGGAAGSVTPMGWTWQGGLAGTQLGRTFGLGVDQVLQIEMILPDGSHVRFGPTEWEDAEGYRYPKTTKVSGVCNENPFAEVESDYVWIPCTNGVNFNDLWFAVRGGGGGTWGVVVSAYLQLHEYPGTHEQIVFDYTMTTPLAACNATEADCADYQSELVSTLAEFHFDFYVAPELITGLTPEEAAQCGSPNSQFLHYCFGGGKFEALSSAWKTRMMERSPDLIEFGVPEEMIEIAGNAVFLFLEAQDYADTVNFPAGHRHFGKASDGPKPSVSNPINIGVVNYLVPKKVALENRDYYTKVAFRAAHEQGIMNLPYLPFPSVENTDDQMSALSEAHRTAAFMQFIIDPASEAYATELKLMFGGADFDGDFPGFIGSNHANVNLVGPLKSDWTKVCPADYSIERVAEACFSQQEVIFGTKRLRRLEKIKADIDPLNLFNCNNCISPAISDDDSSDSEDEGDNSGSSDDGYLVFAPFWLGAVLWSVLSW